MWHILFQMLRYSHELVRLSLHCRAAFLLAGRPSTSDQTSVMLSDSGKHYEENYSGERVGDSKGRSLEVGGAMFEEQERS